MVQTPSHVASTKLNQPEFRRSDIMVKYINNQPVHYRKTTFREEYMDFLSKFRVDYNEEYLFEFLD